MAVTFDAASNSGSFSTVNNISWNHTTTSGDVAVAHVPLETTFAYSAGITAKWGSTGGAGGASMTEISGGPAQFNDGTFYQTAALYFITASGTTISGTQEVTVAWGRSGFGCVGASTSLGGDQTTPLNNPQLEASGAANSNLTVTSAVGNLVIDAFSGNAGQANFTQNQTSLFKVGASICGAAQRAAGAATVAMNITSAAVQHAHIAAQVQVAAAGGGVVGSYYYRQVAGMGGTETA